MVPWATNQNQPWSAIVQYSTTEIPCPATPGREAHTPAISRWPCYDSLWVCLLTVSISSSKLRSLQHFRGVLI